MKLYEFITVLNEAAYDGMIKAMKDKWPEQVQNIDTHVKWAKANLQKQDRIVWYLNILKGVLTNNLGAKLLGDYRFSSIEKLQQDILHFFGYQYAPIQNYVFTGKTASQIIKDLAALEKKFIDSQEKDEPVKVQPGDHKLYEFGDGTAWWFVDRAYCADEGRSGQHCGNIVGQQEKDQRILSLRNRAGNVILTFILAPDGKLGEMKAKGNRKPDAEFHPHIVRLLQSPKITGISGMGFLPDSNFSMMDLSEQELGLFDSIKPKLISDQLSVTPVEILKAPKSIKQKYKKYAIAKMPALDTIIDGPDNIAAWQQAVDQTPDLIIFAPHNMPGFKEKLFAKLRRGRELLLKAPASISKNPELLKEIVANVPESINAISPNVKNYKELCMIAVKGDGAVLEHVPKELRTPEMCMIAVKGKGWVLSIVPEELRTPEMCMIAVKSESLALEHVPKELRTPEMCMIAVKNNSAALYYVPKELRTPEMCMIAVKGDGWALEHVPKELRTPEMCMIAVKDKAGALEHVPKELRTPEMCMIAVKGDGTALYYVPEKLRTPEMCMIAVKNNRLALRLLPDSLKQQIKNALSI